MNDGGKERTRLEVDEFKSRVVVSVFNEVLKGKGLIEITKELNSRGIASPTGKGWGKTGLRKILGNEVYTGTAVWGRNSKRTLPPVRVENACLAIVGRESFQQVQSLLGQRSFVQVHPRRASSQYLLSGLTRCGHCGKALIGMEAKSGKFAYYVCGTLTKKGAGSCRARYLNARKLESLVVNKIREHALTPDNLTALAELVCQEFHSNSEVYRTDLGNTDNQITDAIRRLERLYDVIETGKISLNDVGPRIRELRERYEKLQARKEELNVLVAEQTLEVPSLEEVRECAADLRNSLERGSLSERKAFIRSFVKEVRIAGDEAKLTYTLPMLSRGLREETESVLAIVHRGGRYWT